VPRTVEVTNTETPPRCFFRQYFSRVISFCCKLLLHARLQEEVLAFFFYLTVATNNDVVDPIWEGFKYDTRMRAS